MSEKRLRDMVTFGTPPDEIAPLLRAVSAAIADAAQWIDEHHPRDERRVLLCNLLRAPLSYIDLYAQNSSGQLPVLLYFSFSAEFCGSAWLVGYNSTLSGLTLQSPTSPEQSHKRRYRVLRIPHAVFNRVIHKMRVQ